MPSQWETSVQSNAFSHWLGANLEWTLFRTYYNCAMEWSICSLWQDLALWGLSVTGEVHRSWQVLEGTSLLGKCWHDNNQNWSPIWYPPLYTDILATDSHLGLTHWGRDKMTAISQTIFSNAFSWMKMYKFRLGFHWSLFPRVHLTKFQH